MTTQNVTRVLTIRSTTEGVDQSAASLNKLSAAHDGLARSADVSATVTDISSRRQLSLAGALERMERNLDATYRAQKNFEKAQRDINAALAQNPALQEQANRVLALAAERYHAVAAAADRAAAAQKKAAQDIVNKQTIMPNRAADFAALGKSLDDLQGKYSPLFRLQQAYRNDLKELRDPMARVALGARGQADAIQQTKDKFAQAVIGLKAVPAANDNVSSSFQRMAQALAVVQGPLGPIAGRLSSIGTLVGGVGISFAVAAVSVAALAFAFHQAATASLALADRAGKLKDFAETTGFTVIQLQALEKAGAQVGVSSESVTKGLERFSRQMVDVRKSTGETYDQLARVDIGLARQVSRTENLADAWDLVSKAIKAAPLEQANKIAVAFFGREGIQQTRLMRAGADAGGIAGLVSQLKEIDRILPEQADRWDNLGDAIAENMKAAKQNITSIFADSVLQSLKEMSEVLLVASREAKGFDWSQFAAFFSRAEQVLPVLTLLRALTQPANTGVTHGLTSPQADAALGGMAQRGAGQAASTAAINESAEAKKRETDETIRLSNEEKKRMEALGGAATANDKRIAKEKEIRALIAEYPHLQQEATRQLADFNREQASSALSSRIGLMGDMATVTDAATQSQNKINEAIKNGARFTDEEKRRIKERDAVRAEATSPDAQIGIQRQAIFLLEEEAQIRQQLLAWGVRWNSAEGERLAGGLRFNNQLKEIKDIASTSLAGFAKDINNGIAPMDALVNQAKRLQDIFIDMAAKKIVNEAMGAAFGGASQTAGASASSTVFNSAATSMVSIWLAGASAVHQILTGASAEEAAVRVASAATAAGIEKATTKETVVTKQAATLWSTTLEMGASLSAAAATIASGAIFAGFVEVAAAVWAFATQNWLALILAAVVALTAALGLSGDSAEKQRQRQAIQGYRDRATLARTDTSTREGALSEFDLRANAERAALPNGGRTEGSKWYNPFSWGNKGGRQTDESRALDQALAAERLRVIEDFGKRAVEAEKQAAADRLATIEDFGRAMNEVKGLSFLNDFADLAKQIATYSTAGVDPAQIEEFRRLSAQQIVDDADVMGEQFALLSSRFGDLTVGVRESNKAIGEQIEEQKRLADEQQRLAEEVQRTQTAAGRSIVDYINGLLAGPQSTLSPGERLAASRSTWDATRALAQGGNADAQNRATQDFETYRIALRDMFGSSMQYQAGVNQGLQELLALPAVTAATDPVVIALRDTIKPILDSISAHTFDTATGVADLTFDFNGDGIISAIELMQGALKTAIDAGNAQQIAGALAGYFDQLNTTADGGLDFQEFVAGLGPQHAGLSKDSSIGGLLTDAQLRAAGLSKEQTLGDLYNWFDLDKDGLITKQEAIKVATEGTSSRTESVRQLMDTANSLANTTNSLANTTNSLSDQIRANIGTSNAILAEVRDFNRTSRDHLDLMKNQLTQVPINATLPSANGQTTSSVTINNRMLEALNKIVVNTGLIVLNQYWQKAGGAGYNTAQFAQGGVIPPHGLALVSEHSPGGGRFIRAGSEPITVSPFSPSTDNSAVASRIDRLTSTIETLMRQNNALLSRIASLEEQGNKTLDRVADDASGARNDADKKARRGSGAAARSFGRAA